jgi:hypothetical protein
VDYVVHFTAPGVFTADPNSYNEYTIGMTTGTVTYNNYS